MASLPEATITYLTSRLQRVFAPFALVPFNFVGGVTDGQRVGGGQARVGLTVAQNTPLLVWHDLARVPIGALVLDNGMVAQTRLQITLRTPASVTVTPLDAALSAGSVLFIF